MSFWDKMKSTISDAVNERKVKENQLAEEVRSGLSAYENLWKNNFIDSKEIEDYKSYWNTVYNLTEQKLDSFLHHMGFSYQEFKS